MAAVRRPSGVRRRRRGRGWSDGGGGVYQFWGRRVREDGPEACAQCWDAPPPLLSGVIR